ncbi:MAG: DNA repair protein RecN [Leptolyngbya sp. DLM2.Bin15]|nr:MAG: DNA repair protein RecN [Leptolyngbya sp. DLM2.Bin15]
MLTSLQVENFALVDSLSLDFAAGLNVLTGETGAGKSIILDALDAALGGKMTSRVIRSGSERALVEATFDLNPALIRWLDQQEIDLLDELSLVCSRELTAGRSGVRSRSRVNGVVMNKQQMQSLREHLLEITAQGQTIQLSQANLQREWLDGFGGNELLRQKQVVAEHYQAAQTALKALEKRRQFEQQRLQQLDLFEYQAKELAEAHLNDPQELEHLQQEQQRLNHCVELQQQSYQVYQALYDQDEGGDACSDLLGKAESILSSMVQYDDQIQPILDMVTSALAQVEEAGRQMNAYGAVLEADPDRLQEVECRIAELKQICRKYGPTLPEAIAYSEQVQADLESLSDSGQSLDALEAAYQEQQDALIQTCRDLTRLRQAAAQQLEAGLLEELKPLAMEKVQFRVDLTPITPSVHGSDRITFLLSPNPGEPLQPLADIASGGEMSRFLLALKVCLSQVDAVGTMVFDEIDAGVSGRVAQAIADKLHQLSRHRQVLCVTHQPIIAAQADLHLRVNKEVVTDGAIASPSKGSGKGKPSTAPTPEGDDAVRTVVRVVALDEQQRLEELAQLAGGKTDHHAITFAGSLRSQVHPEGAAEPLAPTTDAPTSEVPPKAASGRKKASAKSSSTKSSSNPSSSDQSIPTKPAKSSSKSSRSNS